MKIANIRTLHKALFGKNAKPTHKSIDEAYGYAGRRGLLIGPDGRAYAPFKPSAPLLPDGSGRRGRWEKGQIVPRKRVS